MSASSSASESNLNWTAIAALYAGLVFGIGVMLLAGQYRNATWLGLLGLAGGCTAYGRVLARRGRAQTAKWWRWASGVLYAAFFLWAGTVFLRALFG
ncbi:hypothetical protein [Salinibacter grassmerensis]|uniref:hypothetical protein n=1 Tax=Salinibacter grassmerensis TaxID=3040353 RepID=UPI0021E884D4|nr:hypothetical protein [Salinibacter grassmerensis]